MDQDYEELQEVSGTIRNIIYENEENGYAVFNLDDGSKEGVVVTGCFPCLAVGEKIIVNGEWTNHSSYGKQFKAAFADRFMPTSEEDIYAYLAAGAIAGIGPALAAQIVNTFSEKSLDVIERFPEKLATIKGIGANKAKLISAKFAKQVGLRRLMEYLCSYHVRPLVALRLYRYYSDRAIEVVQENPYIIAAAHIGGTFNEADRFAMDTGVDEFSRNRVNAATIYELAHNSGNGHCFIPREKLRQITAEMIGVTLEDVDESIEELIEAGMLRFEYIAGCNACYLPELYEAETYAAATVAAMTKRHFKDTVCIDSLLDKLEKEKGITYDARQRETLELVLKNQIVVITGGPGTGKTTSVCAILTMFEHMGLRTLLTAPTGRAAKRMSEVTGYEAGTIHRLLGAQFDEAGEKVIFTKNESERLTCDAVILDECSMVDISLFSALLKALPPDARLVLVGDKDQLPSVGPGDVFSAIIRSNVVPSVRLTQIYRQSERSNIIRNAHMINNGEHPDFSENTGGFFRLKRLQAAGAVETITELYAVRLPTKMNISLPDIQVLVPTRKGETGTVMLNKRLQEVLNPPVKGKREKTFGETIFREGDKVMQIRNNYDIMWFTEDGSAGNGIFNGDVGYIVNLDHEAEMLTINFDGRLANYSFENLNELEHAWAITVHKAQGSEFKAVILVLAKSAPQLLARDILYTAVTRAKDLLIMVGDDATAYQMIDNNKQSKRYNALRVRLRTNCGVV